MGGPSGANEDEEIESSDGGGFDTPMAVSGSRGGGFSDEDDRYEEDEMLRLDASCARARTLTPSTPLACSARSAWASIGKKLQQWRRWRFPCHCRRWRCPRGTVPSATRTPSELRGTPGRDRDLSRRSAAC